jgi:hypothetical protein
MKSTGKRTLFLRQVSAKVCHLGTFDPLSRSATVVTGLRVYLSLSLSLSLLRERERENVLIAAPEICTMSQNTPVIDNLLN